MADASEEEWMFKCFREVLIHAVSRTYVLIYNLYIFSHILYVKSILVSTCNSDISIRGW